MNYGMIATGNHWDFDSLRVHPPPVVCVYHPALAGGSQTLPYGCSGRNNAQFVIHN